MVGLVYGNMDITLAIIGTSGRKDDEKKLSRESFISMCNVAEALIKTFRDNNYSITHLVSGGAAYSDHVAVKLFIENKVSNLRLFIPCKFENGKFADENGGVRKFNPPGKTLNYYHDKFQRKTNINSLSEILVAKERGAEILPCKGGFYGRNSMVAKSDCLLAFTFGEGEMVKEEGTADTVSRYLTRVEKEGCFNKSFHYNLNDGKIYQIREIPEVIEKEN